MGATQTWANQVKLTLRFALSAAIFVFLATQISLAESLRVLSKLDVFGAILSVGLMIGLMIPATFRWYYVLHTFRTTLPFCALLRMNLASSFASQALPTSLAGDALRAEWLRRSGLVLSKSVTVVTVDRLLAFLCLWIVVLCALPVSISVVGLSRADLLNLLSSLTPLLLAVFGTGVISIFALIRLRPEWVRNTQAKIALTARTLRSSPYRLTIFAHGLLVHLMRVLAVVVLANSMSIEVSVWLCLALVPIALFIAMLPISIAGWGVREGIFATVFVRAGISLEEAIALSVAFGLAWLASAIPGALFLGSPVRGDLMRPGDSS